MVMNLESIKKRVQQYFPGSMAIESITGKYHIEHDDCNLNDIFLFDDCDSIEDAWKLAWESTKIYQNINRTHPLKKLISQDIKLKNSERITNRIQRHEY